MGFLFFFASATALAQFNFQTYHNTNSLHFTLLDSTRDSDLVEANPYFGTFLYQYYKSPIDYKQGSDGSGNLVSQLQSLYFAGEYSFQKHFSMGFDSSIHQLDYYKKGSTFSFGDIRFFSKYTFYDQFPDGYKASIVPSVYLPSGNKDIFLSNPNGGYGLNFVLEKKWGDTHAVINLGAEYFPGATYRKITYEQQKYLGLGVNHDLTKQWSIQAEWLGRDTSYSQMGDVYAGGEYKLSTDRMAFFGVSLASTDASKEYRVFAGIKFSPASTKVYSKKTEKKIETIQQQEKIFDCRAKPFRKQYKARPVTTLELLSIKKERLLPYTSQPQWPMITLAPGEHNKSNEQGLPYVQDAQVLFAVDFNQLPARDSVISIKTLDLNIKIRKTWQPNESKTDMICILNEQVCSGDVYSQKSKEVLINQHFFSGKEPPNDYFTQQITTQPTGSLSEHQLKLSIEKLISNTIIPSTMDLIYLDAEHENVMHRNTLYFTVTHDIFVHKDITVNMELSVQSCTEITPDPVIRTRSEEKVIESTEGQNE